ncbi:hypothetical protein NRA66_08600 [Acinetobacter baumannii]|uniref:hypothetical protein n=1 Tax=Acinetobacter baumannii TaxID=470 RepID=UPI0003DF8DE6|nr:hypothetical protein [Acinetobacter baumannii]ETQ99733.1 hypothetical protein P673_0019 [Acinetobacter baumannii UH6507]MDC5549527.1 hypothetical protein [Acinetobacter baumannii]OTN30728.1 hypothetical protein B9Y13_10345 [Acinetobacter baumannii]
MNKLKLKGRPKKGLFEGFGTQAWFYAVQNAASNKTAYSLEKEFFPKNFKKVEGKVIRPRLFDRYKQGKISVGENLVNIVEKSYSGTADWFHAIIWNILDERCSELEYNLWLLALDKNLTQSFFKITIASDGSPRIQIKELNQKNLKRLKQYDLVDVFTLAVISVLISIEKKNLEILKKALHGYHIIRPRLQEHPVFSNFYANFLSALDLYLIKKGEQTFGVPIPLIIWEYDPIMTSHPNMMVSTINDHNSPQQHISDGAYLARAQVSCFENYYCQGELNITIRLYYSIPLGLSLLQGVDYKILIPFAIKFFPSALSPNIIAQDKENIITMTMIFGDAQDWKTLEHLVGRAVLQEVIYFNEDRFGEKLTLFWKTHLGLVNNINK